MNLCDVEALFTAYRLMELDLVVRFLDYHSEGGAGLGRDATYINVGQHRGQRSGLTYSVLFQLRMRGLP